MTRQNMYLCLFNRGANAAQTQKMASTAPLESELMDKSPVDSSSKGRTTELSTNPRERRRQMMMAKRMSTSDTMFTSGTTFLSNNHSTSTNADELQRSGQSPVETLTYCFNRIEKEDEDDKFTGAADLRSDTKTTTVSCGYLSLVYS